MTSKIVTTTATGTAQPFLGQKHDVAPNGRWWALLPSGTDLRFYVSDDEGDTWTLVTGALSGTDAQFLIDEDGVFHVAHGPGVQYKRGIAVGLQISWTATSVMSSSQYRPLSITAHRDESTGTNVHILSSRYYTRRTANYVTEYYWMGVYSSGDPDHNHTGTVWSTESDSNPLPSTLTHTHSFEGTTTTHTHDLFNGGGSSYIGTREVLDGYSTSHYSYVYHHRISVSGNGRETVVGSENIGGNYGSSGHSEVGFITAEGTGLRGRTTAGRNLRATWVRGNGTLYYRPATYSAGAWTWGTVASDSAPAPSQGRLFSALWDGTDLWVLVHAAESLRLYKSGVLDDTAFAPDGVTPDNFILAHDGEGMLWIAASHSGTDILSSRTYDGVTWSSWAAVGTVPLRSLGLVSKGHPAGTRIDAFALGTEKTPVYRYVQLELLVAPPLAPLALSPHNEGVIEKATFQWEHRDRADYAQSERVLAIRREEEGSPWRYIVGTSVFTDETREVTSAESTLVPRSTFTSLGGPGGYIWKVATANSVDPGLGPYSDEKTFDYRYPVEGWGATMIG